MCLDEIIIRALLRHLVHFGGVLGGQNGADWTLKRWWDMAENESLWPIPAENLQEK